jgi:hypothetical protein
MPVGVGEDDTNGGGDRGGIWRSGSCVSRQDQPVDGAENVGCAMSHHRLDVPGVTVEGTREAQCRPIGRQEPRGQLTTVVDEEEVGEASCARRCHLVGGGRGSG